MGTLLSTCPAFAQMDTISVNKNELILIEDSLIKPENDTVIVLSSSTKYRVFDNKHVLSDGFYDSVYAVAKKSKITEELYNLLIVKRPSQASISIEEPVKSEMLFEQYKDKTIISISYVAVELFAGSVNDTTIKAKSRLVKLSNRMHYGTSKNVIKKHVLFEVGDDVNPFEMADTERIIRSLPYIEDARVLLRLDEENPSNIHVVIVTKDRFPWSPNFAKDNNNGMRLGLTNQNIIGTGNELGLGYFYHKKELPRYGYDAHYTMRNIKNSFVDASLFVSDNYLGKSKGVTFARNFISPEIKYYGEATFEHVQPIVDLTFADSIYEKDFHVDRKSYDIWVSRSFPLSKRKDISTALRIQHDNFSKRPAIKADSNVIYHNHHFLLGGVSYSKVNYLKTKNILSFNITEDIPTGFIYSVFLGHNYTEFGRRPYYGFQMIHANYHARFGYFLLDIQSGSFRLGGKKINQIVQVGGRHFTPLFELPNAHARIFTRFKFFKGDQLSIPISETLAGRDGLENIRGLRIRGNQSMSLTSEYVVFQPWYYYGFRFATYANVGIGHISESRNLEPYARLYYSLGGGVRIRNESLVFDTFELGMSLFPNAPVGGKLFYVKVSLATPSFFKTPNVKKPRIVGLDASR